MTQVVYKRGIYGFWKPKGPSSFDVIREIKKNAEDTCIGHAGTLDPLAEGILVVAIGKEFTKKINEEVKKEKEYIAEIHLGTWSTTDDEEGTKTEYDVKKIPTHDEIEAKLQNFVGDILQTPPVWSAIKVKGEEAYKRAERGEVVLLSSRQVHIKEIEILRYEYPKLTIRVVTGPGVYIRSLARDIGEILKTKGYMSGLIRTRVGSFTKQNAISIQVTFHTPQKRI